MVNNTFTVKFNESQMTFLERELSGMSATIAQAKFKAVQRTSARARRMIINEIKAVLNLSERYINGRSSRGETISFRMSNSNTSPSATLTIRQRLMPIIAYKPRFTGSGVLVTINKLRPPLRIKHAFRATVTGPLPTGVVSPGHTGAFTRQKNGDKFGKNTTRGYARRLAIKEQFGPSVLDAIGEKDLTAMGQKVIKNIQDILEHEVFSQVSRFTGKSIEDVKLAYANNI